MPSLKKVAFPAIIERDTTLDDAYFIKFPDFEDLEIFEVGFYDAIVSAQNMLNLFLSKEEFKEINPSTKEELSKKFPKKDIYFITPAPKYYYELQSYESYYHILKFIKSDLKNFDNQELMEIEAPFNKLIFYLTLLKQIDFLEGYETRFIQPCINEETMLMPIKINKIFKYLIRTTPSKNDKLRNLLYSLKEPLIEEYCNIYHLNKEDETKFIDKIINNLQPCECCSMCNISPLYLPRCLCGLHTYEAFKNLLDKLNCFDNVYAFAKKFLSEKYKFVALPVE